MNPLFATLIVDELGAVMGIITSLGTRGRIYRGSDLYSISNYNIAVVKWVSQTTVLASAITAEAPLHCSVTISSMCRR